MDAWVIWNPYYSAALLQDDVHVPRDGSDLKQTGSFYLAARLCAEKGGVFVLDILGTFNQADVLALSRCQQSITLLTKTMGLPESVIMSYLDHRPPTTIVPVNVSVVALQQQTTDLSYDNHLVPRKIDTRQRIWRPTQQAGERL